MLKYSVLFLLFFSIVVAIKRAVHLHHLELKNQHDFQQLKIQLQRRQHLIPRLLNASSQMAEHLSKDPKLAPLFCAKNYSKHIRKQMV
ncbi:MAG: hypothetical protein Q9M28_09890 [Mariprofundaceae bacterium]|nr:hypothetical protein [Mariprofundaceae bacterium]